jgi:hypothetical protein
MLRKGVSVITTAHVSQRVSLSNVGPGMDQQFAYYYTVSASRINFVSMHR